MSYRTSWACSVERDAGEVPAAASRRHNTDNIERDAGELSIALAIVGRWRRRRRRRGEKLSALGELGTAVAIGQEAIMADAV